MKIRQLKLESFKNYAALDVTFGDGLVCITGSNGAGKTNLLDAIHYLLFTKSAFASGDHPNIRKSSGYFLIRGQFEEAENSTELVCYIAHNQKKIFKKDQIAYDKFSDHIGLFPGVISTPYDSEIIRGTSDIRRKWIDGCLSQYRSDYLSDLMAYQRQLRQRNAFLKSIEGILSPASRQLLDTYDAALVPLAVRISRSRAQFLEEFAPYFEQNLRILVAGHEQCTIQLNSAILEEGFEERFKHNRDKDLLLGRTGLGAHRDDFVFLLDGEPIRRFGSQGQQKSFLIALRLAQFDHLARQTGRVPLLLLDDVFDKLDDTRIRQLLKLITGDPPEAGLTGKGQVFVTDARAERTRTLTKNIPDTQVLEINEGKLVVDEKG